MISKHLRSYSPWSFTAMSLQYLSILFASEFSFHTRLKFPFHAFYALWYRHRGNVQSQSTLLVWKAKEGNSGCEERHANSVKKPADRNVEVDSEWEAQGSVSTQGLCEALLMLGGLLDFVGLRVSGSSPRATRSWSFRPSNFSYHDQASRGCKMQEQALHSTCAQRCHTWSASMALWGLCGPRQVQLENIVLTSLWLKRRCTRQIHVWKKAIRESSKCSTIICISICTWLIA